MNPTKFHNYYNNLHDDNNQDEYVVLLLENMSHKLQPN
jgi:hypothetical protein